VLQERVVDVYRRREMFELIYHHEGDWIGIEQWTNYAKQGGGVVYVYEFALKRNHDRNVREYYIYEADNTSPTILDFVHTE